MDATDLVHVRDLLVRRGAFRLEVPTWKVAPGQVVGTSVGADASTCSFRNG